MIEYVQIPPAGSGAEKVRLAAIGTVFLKHPFSDPDLCESRDLPNPIVDVNAEYLGLWQSEAGSLYFFDGTCFTCVEVHSYEYRGWIGKVAVDNVLSLGSIAVGRQAFRDKSTGAISSWEPIRLSLDRDVVTKFFPGSVSASRLVYGHLERYHRVSSGSAH